MPWSVTRGTTTRYSTVVDRDEIIRVFRAFEAAGLEYVLAGATAMGFHRLVRATEDIDLCIRVRPENIDGKGGDTRGTLPTKKGNGSATGSCGRGGFTPTLPVERRGIMTVEKFRSIEEMNKGNHTQIAR